MSSAMFWINAMGFHTWRVFNMRSSKKPFREDRKKFLLYALYAQGFPLLINIVTAIIDSGRDKISAHYPTMGEIKCFLGESKDNWHEHPSYFESAKFIYHDLFMFLGQLVNAVFLISIAKVLKRGWKNQAERLKLIGWGYKDLYQKLFSIPQGGTGKLRRKIHQSRKQRNNRHQTFRHSRSIFCIISLSQLTRLPNLIYSIRCSMGV